MTLSIVIIGDEILLGRVTDTNSGLIARTFSDMGWHVAAVRTVGDDAGAIRAAITASLDEADLVVTTGGLGPTRDDITKSVMLDIFGGTLIHDDAVAANIEAIFADRKIKINELTRLQAMVPSSCRVIMNTLGTAPVMLFERGGKVLVAMPGVPYETRGMLPAVAATVTERMGRGSNIAHREYTVCGISESALAERLAAYEDSLPRGYKLAYLPSPGEIVLRLDAELPTDAAAAEYDRHTTELEHLLGANMVARGKATPAELLLHRLRAKGYTVATAESCTGGNIAHLITSIPGCSDVMTGGVVSYSNEVKINALGVAPGTIERHGAVSAETVAAMARGVQRLCGADCAIATSGIAGPGGAVPGKPVGTVWIAVATPGHCTADLYHFGGDRQAVIDRASAAALRALADTLAKE